MEDQPFVIESPTRIRLGPIAKFWAGQRGISLEAMARYILAAEQLRDSGWAQRDGEN
jgi:hypothetical protein